MSAPVRSGDPDGCMTWLSTTRTTMSMAGSRCSASIPGAYGVTRALMTSLAAPSSEPALVVSRGSSSVSAPWVALTTACSSLLALA